jgi:hypothetical protein
MYADYTSILNTGINPEELLGVATLPTQNK